jgi:putative phosphoesterase
LRQHDPPAAEADALIAAGRWLVVRLRPFGLAQILRLAVEPVRVFAQQTPMRIAVLADTHNRYPPGLPARLAGADEIWHLGDVCEPEVLVEFELLGKPLHVVLGNNEAHNLWPLSLQLEREGWSFFLVHIPPRHAPAGVHAVLHGHTHVPRDETDPGGVRWLNPGCISRPNRGAPPSFAWLTVERGRAPGWKLIHI